MKVADDAEWIMRKLLYGDLTEKTIGAMFEVHKGLGPGLSENIYRRAVLKELDSQGIKATSEKEYPISYKGEEIGRYRLDIVVEDKVVLELKALSRLEPVDEAQILTYLKGTEFKLGLLANFGEEKLKFKRFILDEARSD
jgi:GxxExxY protein